MSRSAARKIAYIDNAAAFAIWRLVLMPIERAHAPVLAVALIALFSLTSSLAFSQARQSNPTVGPSNLPLPRFVSLKITPANLRRGPGTSYPIDWVLRQSGMPLEILREFDNWRQVRDADSTVGWIHGAFLSGRRTATVQPWTNKQPGERPVFNLYRSAAESSGVVARLEAGTVVDIVSCDGSWCEVWIEQFNGHIEQKRLWGVYEGETVE